MLKINLNGDLENLTEGINLISKTFNIEINQNGIPITVKKDTTIKDLIISYDGSTGFIQYNTTNSFFRLLNLWTFNYKKQKKFSIKEVASFKKTGIMIDASRNAVLNLNGMKNVLDYLAKLGLNQVMLYTEETYEVKEYPYFGYLRGRYTQEELTELDDYAFALGIEMVPCIQTLGHLYLALKYEYAIGIKDTSDVLLVGEPKTYEFLDHLIRTASEPFRSNRIHIGMDETFGLGTGIYRQKNGIRDNFSIMNEHLEEVVNITNKYNLEPMMWSDMYFRFGSKTGDYYDVDSKIPEEIIDKIPNVDMVFWDYYHEDEELYDVYFNKHKALDKKIIFAGGIWTWNGIAPNYGKTFESTKAALASAKRNSVQEVFATLWGDDGGETPVLTALPGFQLFAEMTYRDDVNQTRMEEEFYHNTGYTLEKFMVLNELDETPGVLENNLNTSATSKVLLWQDPLLGYYDKNIEGLNLNQHYEELTSKIAKLLDEEKELNMIFEFYYQLSDVLSIKSEFGLLLKEAYDNENKEKLKQLLETSKLLKHKLKELRKAHQKVWMKYNKPFGWEVLDIRYGGTINRIDTTHNRLLDYLNSEITKIEELEEEKLLYKGPYDLGKGTIGRGLYQDMVTPGKLSGV